MHYLHIQLLSKNLHAIKKELPYLWEKKQWKARSLFPQHFYTVAHLCIYVLRC